MTKSSWPSWSPTPPSSRSNKQPEGLYGLQLRKLEIFLIEDIKIFWKEKINSNAQLPPSERI